MPGKKNPGRKIPVVPIRDQDKPPPLEPDAPSAAISSIYGHTGTSGDLHQLDRARRPRHRTLLIVIGILAVLVATSLVGLYVFTRGSGKFTGDGVKVAIASDERIASGSEITFTATYENTEPVALGNVVLTANFPEGFTLKRSSPEFDAGSTNAWTLPNVPSGKGGSVRITGTIVGEVGSVVTLTATLSYTPASFNATFLEGASRSVSIASSMVNVEIVGPLRVLPERETTYRLRYANAAEEPVERLRITATYPEGFSFAQSDPKASEGNATWEIARVEPKASGDITVTGKFTGASGDLRELRAAIGVVDRDGAFRKQLETSTIVLLVNPELTVQLAINGTTEDQTVSLGDTLDVLLTYRNNSELEMNDVTLKATIQGLVLDWKLIDDERKGTVEGSAVTWTKTQIPELANLKPGAGGELRFRLPLVSTVSVASLQETNVTIRSAFSASSQSLKDLDGATLEKESNTVTLKVNTTLTLSAEARYYSDEGEQLGSGPLPPTVGKTTTYRLFWYLANSTNELSSVTLTMALPSSALWTGKNVSYASGELTYDAATRTVRWAVPTVRAGAGQLSPNVEAAFEVATTPEEGHVGLPVTLTGAVSASGQDAFTGATRSDTVGPLTTDLTDDPLAAGKGIVQPASVPAGNANTNAP